MGARAESLAYERPTAVVVVNRGERMCLLCEYYSQYYTRSVTSIAGYTPVNNGYCALREEERAAVSRPCCRFELKERFAHPIVGKTVRKKEEME